MVRALVLATLVTVFACEAPPPLDLSGPTAGWDDYGGSRGGERYSPLTQITPANVRFLEPAWEFHTGDVSDGSGPVPSTSAFEVTPILADGTLYFCSPFNKVFALDPETGEERWRYDPEHLFVRHPTDALDSASNLIEEAFPYHDTSSSCKWCSRGELNPCWRIESPLS